MIVTKEGMDISWALTEPVDVMDAGGAFAVKRVNGVGAFTISFGDENTPEPRRMLINFADIELGDDFIAFISLIDDYYEQGGEPGKVVRLVPFEDSEEL